MENASPLKKPRVFYGYWIVAAAFMFVFISQGGAFFAFSLFVRSLQTDLGWGRGEIMIAFTMFLLTHGVAAVFVGRVVDRYGVKRVVLIGAVVAGIGYVLLSQMSDLWHYYLGYFIIGAGAAGISIVPSSAVVSNWFERKRGFAIGIMSSGVGLSGFVLAPLVGGYLIPSFGWRASYFALAVFIWVVVIPLALLVVKTKPADMGLYPDGAEAPQATSVSGVPPSASRGLTLGMALATPAFWLILVAFIFSNFSQVGMVQSQVPYLEDIGFPITAAASALGGVGLGSAIGKFGFGWLCDRMQPKYACAVGLMLQAVSIIIIMTVGPASSLGLVWAYAITMGLGMGSWLPTSSMLTSTNFGLASYGSIYGIVTLSIMGGAAIGPLMAGYMYDAMNSYFWAFIIFLALYIIAIPAILVLRRPKALE